MTKLAIWFFASLFSLFMLNFFSTPNNSQQEAKGQKIAQVQQPKTNAKFKTVLDFDLYEERNDSIQTLFKKLDISIDSLQLKTKDLVNIKKYLETVQREDHFKIYSYFIDGKTMKLIYKKHGIAGAWYKIKTIKY